MVVGGGGGYARVYSFNGEVAYEECISITAAVWLRRPEY